MQSRTDELNGSENVQIYHHELHKKHIQRSQILTLKTDEKTYVGHNECTEYLENSVAELLLQPAVLGDVAQQELLAIL